MAKLATFETTKGTLVAELYPAEAPKTVENFEKLANQGFYDGVKFHRVERSSGSLRRHVKLPPTANLDSITAACDNGILRVTVGKHPDAIAKGPRRITVA